jgi:cytochrome c oxidase subunit II
MSSSPRSRSSQTAIFALAVGAALIGVILILLYYGVNVLQAGQEVLTGLYPPIAVTTQGTEIRNLYTVIFLIAVAIFLVVEGLIIWTVIRYRRKPGDDTLPPQTHGNNIAEFVWTIVPTIIVIFMFFVSWQTLNQVDTTSADAQTKIRALAGQFQWQFDYLAQDGTTVLYTEYIPLSKDGGGMTVPAGRTVLLSLVSNDVIHAFYVPQFLFKRDVVPGRTNQFDFMVNASDAGQTFRGQCAELCGVGHSIMLFDVHALTATEFDAWLAEKVKSNPPPAPSGPAPSGSPASSGAPASGSPAPSGGTPSGAAPSGPAPSGPAPSGGAEGATVKISAKGIAYQESAISTAAGQPFKIEFENEDAGTPHNVAIHQGPASGTEVFKGEIFPGVATKTYNVPALTAGSYTFACTVHPTMTGTLTVQ